MKRKRSGLTIVEMLVVVGIIAILIGLLLPAISMVRRSAAEAKQKVQLAAIDVALVAFRNDYGDYPPSNQFSYYYDDNSTRVEDSSGAQKLTEALMGWDLLGFHPDSGWRADGLNRWPYRAADGTTYTPGSYFLYDSTVSTGMMDNPDLEKRKGRYLDLETANPVQLGVTEMPRNGLFDLGASPLASDTFVLSDVFGRAEDVYVPTSSSVTGTTTMKKVSAGLPILYYRANTSYKYRGDVYTYEDNWRILEACNYTMPNGEDSNPIIVNDPYFYNYITDWRSSTDTLQVPHKPDSYLLITAGWDGRYGTDDDICNFNR